MKSRFHATGSILFAMLALLAGACTAQNIYPDPSFESTGEKGVARTGERAGHVKVDAQQHWVHMGGPIPVEPFATYRVTGYVKGTVGLGEVMAFQCWAWDSFRWAFQRSVVPKSSEDWQEVELTFISPYDHMNIHPLSFIRASDTEMWIDDVTVEKIKSPQETLAELRAKEAPSGEDIQLLARYHAARGEVDTVKALAAKADDYTKADISVVLGLSFRDPKARKPCVVEMLRLGSLGFSNGVQRYNELIAGMSIGDRLDVLGAAVVASPNDAAVADLYRDEMLQFVRQPTPLMTFAENARYLTSAKERVASLVSSVPSDSAAREATAVVLTQIQDSEEDLAKRRKHTGKCVISIGGKALSPKTHAIVIPIQATPQERHAAKDLQIHLELMTGSSFPVVAETKLASRTPIIVGKCAMLAKMKAGINFESLGIEGIAIKTLGPALVLAGNTRGVLYATYTFLEDQLGCKWLTPDCSVIPKTGTFKVGRLDRRYIPPFEMRSTDPPSSREANWAVRNKINGTQTLVDEARGGKIDYRGFVHTFNELVPPHIYRAQHPEYYAQENGKPIPGDHVQLCMTHPKVRRIAIDTIKRWMRESPEATIFSVSQNDCIGYCQCDDCAAIIAREESPAGPLIEFVNAVADAVKDEHPDKIIDTLAYQYSRKPPKNIKPRPNVAVRLCSIECCFTHPLGADPFNKSFVDDIKGWAKLSNRLHIWDYVINFAHSIMPHPNLYVLQPNIKFFSENGAAGMFEEGAYFSKGTEFAELRNYIIAKCLWDPNYITDKAIDEFCSGYYGRAGGLIRQYIDLIHEPVLKNPSLHLQIYSAPHSGHITPEMIAKSIELFDRAEKMVAGDPVLLHRVRVARLPVMYMQIVLGFFDYLEQDDKLVVPEGRGVGAIGEAFGKTCRDEGNHMIGEGRLTEHWLPHLPRIDGPLDLVTIRNPLLEVSVLPAKGGRIYRMRHLPTGRDLIKRGADGDLVNPLIGGYRETAIDAAGGWYYSFYGTGQPLAEWMDKFDVTEQTSRSVSMKASVIRNSLVLVRRIELDEHEAKVRVTSTLINLNTPDRTTATTGLRVHPAFDLWKGQGWEFNGIPMDKQMPLSMILSGESLPPGQWALTNRLAGLRLLITFDRSQVKECRFNWSKDDRWASLELLTPEVKLEPGESYTFTHTYEVQETGRRTR